MKTHLFSHKIIPIHCLSAAIMITHPSDLHAESAPPPTEQIDGYHEFNYGNGTKKGVANWVQAIRVTDPMQRSDVSGQLTVSFVAEKMTEAIAMSWTAPENPALTPPEAWGQDLNLTPGGIDLDDQGRGSFVFDADLLPNGPINVRIYARNPEGLKDIFELQLFNTGGVIWNQGIPDSKPPAIRGKDFQVVFEDDFDGPLSISNDGRGHTYSAHKSGGGDFSAWQFADVHDENNPFDQRGSWLRIAARKVEHSTRGRSGILSSVDNSFQGTWAKAPFYMECRFTAQAAIGSWPAFWTLAPASGHIADELDVAELYGGKGPGNPNHPGYSVVSHFWKQTNPDGSKKKGVSARPEITTLGGKSYWSTTFHTYAVLVDLEETVYYFDDIEVLRHPTNDVSRDNPHFFLINYALGGISRWPVDLTRYDEGSDMWVDYVRVFAKEKVAPGYRPDVGLEETITHGGIGLNFAVEGASATQMTIDGVAGHEEYRQQNWNNLKGSTGKHTELMDQRGQQVDGLTAEWQAAEGASRKTLYWDFKHANMELMSGYLEGQGSATVTGIPFPKYDILVYVTMDFYKGMGTGSVTLKGEEDQTTFYRTKASNGKFVVSGATDIDTAEEANTIRFLGRSDDSFTLSWDGNLKDAPTGVTGIQIIERP
ncbi:family 16 glycosylhydrolase [Kiritimatiellota bacterium B12222]|nr:family 16 glycosylhydrolase [Kiritimatiellota bacterium B12222]